MYIEVNGIQKKFGKKVALDNVSFGVDKGEYVVLLGPTGAGKTTLLRIIAGLENPTQGRVYVDGCDVTALEPEERNITYLSQTYALFPHMSILENVMFARIVKGFDKADARKVAEEFLMLTHLIERKNAYPAEMSGGMMQRVALARALASNSQLMLFDEPLRALDAKLRIMLRSELRKIAKDFKITVIHVTHDEDEAMEMGDRIIVLRRGKIIQDAKPSEIYLNPKTPFVANFVGGGNFFVFYVEKNTGNELILKDAHGRMLTLKKNTGMAEGTKVLVCVRAEHVALSREEVPNAFYGEIRHIHITDRFYEIDFRTEREYLHVKIPLVEKLDFEEGMQCWAHIRNAICFDATDLNIVDELEVE